MPLGGGRLRIKPSIDFLRGWARTPKKLAGFGNYGRVAQYDAFAKAHPDVMHCAEVRAELGAQETAFIHRLFHEARAQYQKDLGRDHWDETLPGDCENQCFWFMRQMHGVGLRGMFRPVLCKTETGAGHMVLATTEYVYPRNCITPDHQVRIIDFRKTEPLLPVQYPAFDKYEWIAWLPPGTPQWLRVFAINV